MIPSACRSMMASITLVLTACWGMAFAGQDAEIPAKPLGELESEDFKTRENAQAAILAWARQNPQQAMDLLYEHSLHADEPEVRERCLDVLRALVNDEYLREGEGYLGIRMLDESTVVPGDPKPRSVIRVLQVVPDSAAAKAGLRVNDLIAGIEDQTWQGTPAMRPFSEAVRQYKPGTRLTLKVVREGALIDLPVVLGRRPLFADNPFLDQRQLDLEAAEKAASEAYFRRWMELRKASD
jgi:hypothetical protein